MDNALQCFRTSYSAQGWRLGLSRMGPQHSGQWWGATSEEVTPELPGRRGSVPCTMTCWGRVPREPVWSRATNSASFFSPFFLSFVLPPPPTRDIQENPINEGLGNRGPVLGSASHWLVTLVKYLLLALVSSSVKGGGSRWWLAGWGGSSLRMRSVSWVRGG